MTDRALRSGVSRPSSSLSVPGVHTRYWLPLAGTVILAAVLRFWRLDQQGYGNLYYAAAVRSMLTSWHNFLFASFDPAGFVSVEKPPLGFWLQAASVRLLGWGALALRLPQALAGVASVVLLYYLVKRTFGVTAGLLAALVLAIMPISVATDRHNTVDGLLVLALLGAAWAALRAAETGRPRFLLLAGILVGLGFNIKALQAFLVLPALCLPYLVAAPLPAGRRLLHLLAAGLVMALVCGSWAAMVDLTPPDQRPFVGHSWNNSVETMVISQGATRLTSASLTQLLVRAHLRPGPLPTETAPAAGIVAEETGAPGAFRFFDPSLAGQCSWWLPLSIIGLAAAAFSMRVREGLGRARPSLLLWGTWLVALLIFFSVAGQYHRYYLVMLAPAIAALAGIELVMLWRRYAGSGPGWLALPLSLLVTGGLQARILAYAPAWGRWLTPMVLGLCLAASLGLIAFKLLLAGQAPSRPALAAATAVLGLAIAPCVWSITPVAGPGDALYPFAGPEVLALPSSAELPDTARLVQYLQANRHGERFLAATLYAIAGAPLMLTTDEPVMALGGYPGSDPILTTAGLAARVRQAEVRFFLLPGLATQRPDLPAWSQNNVNWVRQHCRLVAPELWQPHGRQLVLGPGGPEQLLDCGALEQAPRPAGSA